MVSPALLARIDRHIDIAAPPERVWRALTDPDELCRWFRVAIDGRIAVGEDVWMVAQHPPYVGQRFLVRIVELTPVSRVVWHWYPGEIEPELDYATEAMTTVTFTLEPHEGGTRLSVAETGFDQVTLARRAKVYQDNERGWAEVLGWLRGHAEGTR
jgi:uncharacterized protein YndB with AHSA1/START domain